MAATGKPKLIHGGIQIALKNIKHSWRNVQKEVQLIQLQKPKLVYMGGGLRPWEEALLHVGCEAVTRGLNVFEGVKGYWQPDGRFGIVRFQQHYERLHRSARLLHIPFEHSYDEYAQAVLH
jgi:branched-chain amino acid aminotransferase